MEYIFTCIDLRLWIEKKSLYKTGAIQSTVLYRHSWQCRGQSYGQ